MASISEFLYDILEEFLFRIIKPNKDFFHFQLIDLQLNSSQSAISFKFSFEYSNSMSSIKNALSSFLLSFPSRKEIIKALRFNLICESHENEIIEILSFNNGRLLYESNENFSIMKRNLNQLEVEFLEIIIDNNQIIFMVEELVLFLIFSKGNIQLNIKSNLFTNRIHSNLVENWQDDREEFPFHDDTIFEIKNINNLSFEDKIYNLISLFENITLVNSFKDSEIEGYLFLVDGKKSLIFDNIKQNKICFKFFNSTIPCDLSTLLQTLQREFNIKIKEKRGNRYNFYISNGFSLYIFINFLKIIDDNCFITKMIDVFSNIKYDKSYSQYFNNEHSLYYKYNYLIKSLSESIFSIEEGIFLYENGINMLITDEDKEKYKDYLEKLVISNLV